MTRIGVFIVERCLPVYPVFLTLWVLAAEAITVAGPWRPSWQTVVKILALMAAGVFLRMVDDQKDFDYDTCHHPERPLVQGRITAGELRVAMVPAAVAALVLAAAVSPWAAVLLAATLGYSLALWWTETRVPVVRDNAMVNLAAVCPMQFGVTGFAMAGAADLSWWRTVAVLMLFTAAFLHVEIARKTTRAAGPLDRHSYAQLIGGTASAVLACGFALLAVGLELLVTAPWSWSGPQWPMAWLPLAAVVLPLASAWRFVRAGEPDHSRALPTVFIVVFYLSIIGQGLAG